ncbi:Crotonobetainyl-CoA:carnitine CoA-transferase CaiB [Hyphomicrobiales bacterium]|nr:Crotonobetainyl-CoA:carnitine CoA-transferase CaiB [Hyphomicrobiales bacterium]CAH1693479.1 CoA transferase [Hyphomicrobiales bacterium]
MNPAVKPLEGIKVIEFSHMVMGPTCGAVLAYLGADVIKVEPIGKGDNTRRLPGSGAGFFSTFNHNKRSLAVDMKSEQGQALVRRLIGQADVLTENFRPGALEALGLDYASLQQEFPRLIYCSLKGFLPGPYENRVALDEVVQMMGGLAYMTGPSGRPLRAGAPVNDMMGGMFAVIGILAALRQLQSTGRGQLVRAGLFENNAWLVGPHIAQKIETGAAARPMPERISAWAIYDVFDTADNQQIFVGVVTDTQWQLFCEVFGQPTMLADERLATNAKRVAARETFMPTLRSLFRALTRAEAEAKCSQAKLPFAPIKRPDELLEDPHMLSEGAMTPITFPNGERSALPGLPLEMDGIRFNEPCIVPRVGADSEAIAGELGYGSEEIVALLGEGIISCDSSPVAVAR